MAKIPQPTDTTVARIYRSWEQRENRPPRSHLGASQIGRPCEREVWYQFRWAMYPHYEGRILRLFNRGQREEAVIVDELRAAGITVHEVDPATGKQFQFSDFGGHMGGSMDGAALGLPEAPKTWHVLEFKTHGSKSFAATVRDGVAKAHPEHFAQMQMYMGWSGMDRALYLAVNKDTDELYAERVEFDQEQFDKLRAVAERVIFGNIPPRISDSPAFYKCKFCTFHPVCHGGNLPKANCRTCAHSTASHDGKWRCERFSKVLSVEEQRAGCDDHIFTPHVMPVDPIGSAHGFVAYEGFDNTTVAAQSEPEHFTSKELEQLDLEMIPTAVAAKRAMGGRVVSAP